MYKWKDTTCEEMYVFLAMFMLMGYQMKHGNEMYWSTDKQISTPIFSELMSQDRFKRLLRFLHFNDNSQVDKEYKMYSIQPVYDILRTQFKDAVVPFENLAIDESVVPCFEEYHTNKHL